MKNSIQNEINDNEFDLEEFKKRIPNKMTIHILSKKRKDCISLVEFLAAEKFPDDRNELKEEDIHNKKNLYCFMNYKVYTEASDMMDSIVKKAQLAKKNGKSEKILFYSETIIIIESKDINAHIKEIKRVIKKKIPIVNTYYVPFVIIVSTEEKLDLKGFDKTKTFQYFIKLDDILDYKNYSKNNRKEEIFKFFRKINVLFSYYNELGDEYSFKNLDGKKITIKTDNSNSPIFLNILLLGQTGAGKSTLLNLILDEKKSLEGGTGHPTTTKNIRAYKKEGVPIKIYDVKGIEGDDTANNYIKILTELNSNIKSSYDSLNAIFYCLDYSQKTTFKEPDKNIFDKLIDFNIPIIFIFTHISYNPNEKMNKKFKRLVKEKKDIHEENIKDLLKSSFIKRNKDEKEADLFFKNFVKIEYINSVEYMDNNKTIPVSGIDRVLSFFSELIPKENWEGLKESCRKKDEEKWVEFSQNNIFLKNYKEFNIIRQRNKKKAYEYLSDLQKGAFVTGCIPGVDIAMEYLYRHLFQEKLKFLYGFDYDNAELIIKKISKKNSNKYENNSGDFEEKKQLRLDDNRNSIGTTAEIINNTEKMEQNIENQIDQKVNNKLRNTGTLIRGALNVIGKVGTRFTINAGLKFINYMFFPACVISSFWSAANIHEDCVEIFNIFDEAYTPLRFKTLESYVDSFIRAIDYLQERGKQIIYESNNKEYDEEDEEEEEENDDE